LLSFYHSIDRWNIRQIAEHVQACHRSPIDPQVGWVAFVKPSLEAASVLMIHYITYWRCR
jgi:hypothetical protein